MVALTDTANVVQRSYVYDDWGKLMGGTDAAADANRDRVRWKGALWLGPEADLYYMRNRWYESGTGRFLNEDPIGLDGGINPYTFAGSEPINGADPDGLRCIFKGIEVKNASVSDCRNLGGAWALDPVRVTTARSSGAGMGASSNFGNPCARGARCFNGSNTVPSWSHAGFCGTQCAKGAVAFPPPSYGASIVDACVVEHYSPEGLAFRSASALGSITVGKRAAGIPIAGEGASANSNALSYFGLKAFPGAKIGRQVLGTNRMFGLAGRLNIALGVGLASYDLTSIGMCISQ